jgi:hypothetical protein
MSRLLAVAARELRERWLLFPGAFVAGFLTLVMPAFGVSRELVPTMGLTGAALLGVAAAVVIGSSMLARDAADGRLGFLFSRPLPWGTIWGGKWLAAIALATASAFLYSIPWMATYPLSSLGGRHGDSWLGAMLDGPGTGLGFMVIVLTVGLANFGATLFRSRSPWLALDLVLMLAATWATWRYFAPLWLYGILGRGQWTILLVLLPLALGLLVGSVAQVAVGRTDLQRAHRALSLGFWAVIGLTLTGAAGAWLWVRSTGPDAVSVHTMTRDAAGRWIYVEGTGQHSGWYPHGFLIDTTTGRYLARPGPVEELQRIGFPMLFSADGRFGALPVAARGGAALILFDLREASPRVTEVALESSPPPTWNTVFALSPTAASMFVVHESGASFYELPSGRRVATTTIPPGWRPAAARYLAEGAARAWLIPGARGPRCAWSTWRSTVRRAAPRSRSPRPSIRCWCGAAPCLTPMAGGSSRWTRGSACGTGPRASRSQASWRAPGPSRRSSSRTGASWSRAAPPAPASRPHRTRACGSSIGSERSSRTSSSRCCPPRGA